MNRHFLDNANPKIDRHRTWTGCAQLLLVGWFLATTGCAYTAKLQPFTSAIHDGGTATIEEPKQPSESASNDTSSQPEQIELVAYQDEEIPAPPSQTTSELVPDGQTIPLEHLPLPEISLQPISPAVGLNPQQQQQQQYHANPSATTSAAIPQIVNIRGASFRESPKTATEIMLELRAENERLRHQLTAGKHSYENLVDQLKDQQKINQQLVSKIDRSQTESVRLRAMVSKLKVAVDRLVVDKANIKKQSEATLREIESNLDTVLLDSITRARQ